jgi:SAM-dependent methyltransferase
MPTDYTQSAEYYDLWHAGDKDYAAEAAVLADLIRERNPGASRLLDVGCGTGRHAQELTALGFIVDGIDLEPAFIAAAGDRNPFGRFVVADMTSFDLAARYDAILCLFSTIGYARTDAGLEKTLGRIAAHLAPAGIVIIDPWFEPGELVDRHIDASCRVTDGAAACRVTRTFIDGARSRLEFDYLVARPGRVEHRSETHMLGLFTEDAITRAFRAAGLVVERRRGVLRRRGLYAGWHESLGA